MTLFIVSFIAGVLTVLAPCILPLLPVIFAGSVSEVSNKRRPFVIIGSLALSVFAFTLLLKGTTAIIDISPTFWQQISAAILLLFGLTLVFPVAWAKIILMIPGHNRPDFWLSRGYQNHTSWWADVLVGVALGPVFSTCSPTYFVILASVLPNSLSTGIIYLLAYIAGLSLALLLIARIGQKLVDKLGWATNPEGWFRKILGILFIILAVLISLGIDRKIETQILNSGFFDVTKIEQSISSYFIPNENPIDEPANTNSTSTPAINATSTPVSTGFVPKPKPGKKYIELVRPEGFINSEPFALKDLVGKKVIMIDFMAYSCINCQRTFPYMNDWYKKYKDQGFEIVAVHTPEFAFEKVRSNIEKAAKDFKLQFPIVMDNNYATWNAYRNNAWPHKYLIDINGNVVYDHIGEGAYDETEEKIVELLNERKKLLGETGVITKGDSLAGYSVDTKTPEIYFGAFRNYSFGNGRTIYRYEDNFSLPTSLDTNRHYFGGKWKIEEEYSETNGENSRLAFVFNASKMYLVASSADGSPISAIITIDGKPVDVSKRGDDLKESSIIIDESKLYNLFKDSVSGEHRIDIIFSKPGVRVFTFTFG